MSVDYYINCAIVVTLCVFVVVELPKESSDNSNRRETWNESKDWHSNHLHLLMNQLIQNASMYGQNGKDSWIMHDASRSWIVSQKVQHLPGLSNKLYVMKCQMRWVSALETTHLLYSVFNSVVCKLIISYYLTRSCENWFLVYFLWCEETFLSLKWKTERQKSWHLRGTKIDWEVKAMRLRTPTFQVSREIAVVAVAESQ